MTPLGRIVALPGVYRPRSDTMLLAESLGALRDAASGRRWLDVCSGTGAIAITAARAGVDDVTAVDVSRRAVCNIRLNALLNGVRVRATRGDLFAPVAGERFDVIVSNPPYVPAASDAAAKGVARAWDAGTDGRSILDRICNEAPDLLLPGGVLLLVQSSLADLERTERLLARRGMAVEALRTHTGPLGPIARARRDLLLERGLLGADETEDLVVLRAELVSAAQAQPILAA